MSFSQSEDSDQQPTPATPASPSSTSHSSPPLASQEAATIRWSPFIDTSSINRLYPNSTVDSHRSAGSSPKVRRLFRWFLVVSLGLILFFSGLLVALKLTNTSIGELLNPVATIIPNAGIPTSIGPTLNKEMILLVMGVDVNHDDPSQPFANTRTDTMLLLRLDPATKVLRAISIPRDSKVYLANNRGVDKINAAHALGGPELAIQTLQNTLGVPIDHYITVNLSGVRDVVDAIGGVDLYIAKPLHYIDRTARLTIDFEPGEHHLNGQQAESYLRFRHDALGDIGRIRRQQHFVWALLRKLQNDPLMFTRLPAIVGTLNKHVRTDLNTQDMIAVATFMKHLKSQQLQVSMLPGRPSQYSVASYWIINPDATEKLLKEFLASPTKEEATVDSADQRVPIGLYYTRGQAANIAGWQSLLEQAGFRVVCQQRVKGAFSMMLQRVSDQSLPSGWLKKFQALSPQYEQLEIFHAFSQDSAFDFPPCSPSEQAGLVVGDDLKLPTGSPAMAGGR